ncbi:MAG: zinc-ribbon domain-containing protein [Armatimonadia bacterium]|nr:zinc-ribbon domain-containing protein [Armatimonadia bacterium]
MRCPHCGRKNPEHEMFCQNCGEQLPDEGATVQGSPTAEQGTTDRRQAAPQHIDWPSEAEDRGMQGAEAAREGARRRGGWLWVIIGGYFILRGVGSLGGSGNPYLLGVGVICVVSGLVRALVGGVISHIADALPMLAIAGWGAIQVSGGQQAGWILIGLGVFFAATNLYQLTRYLQRR